MSFFVVMREAGDLAPEIEQLRYQEPGKSNTALFTSVATDANGNRFLLEQEGLQLFARVSHKSRELLMTTEQCNEFVVHTVRRRCFVLAPISVPEKTTGIDDYRRVQVHRNFAIVTAAPRADADFHFAFRWHPLWCRGVLRVCLHGA